MEQTRESRNKPKHNHSTKIWQGSQEHSMQKRQCLQQIELGSLNKYKWKDETGPISYTLIKIDSKGIRLKRSTWTWNSLKETLKTQAASALAWHPSALQWIHTESAGTTQNKQAGRHQTEHRSHQRSERTVCTTGETCATRASDRRFVSKGHRQLIQSGAEGNRSKSTNFQLQDKY